jgi:methionine-rich copper-binding protein CopC
MKRLLAFLSIAIFSSTGAQAANIQLLKSAPADGSVADTPLPAFVLQFSDEVQLHSLQLRRDDQKRAESVGNLPHKQAAAFTIPAPSLTSGGYVLEWEVFTRDSRALRGSVRFTVSGGQLKSTLSSAHQ